MRRSYAPATKLKFDQVLYARMRIFSYDNAARGCARLLPDPFTGRLRRWKAHSRTPRATSAGYTHLAEGHLLAAAEKVGGIIAVQMPMRHTMI